MERLTWRLVVTKTKTAASSVQAIIRAERNASNNVVLLLHFVRQSMIVEVHRSLIEHGCRETRTLEVGMREIVTICVAAFLT
jgi:hypothetical protein